MPPQPGATYYVGASCGVPWNHRPIAARVIRAHDWGAGWEGMTYLDIYELDDHGCAIERRTIYVIEAGLVPVLTAAALPPGLPACTHIKKRRKRYTRRSAA